MIRLIEGLLAMAVWFSGGFFFWCMCAAAGNSDERKGWK